MEGNSEPRIYYFSHPSGLLRKALNCVMRKNQIIASLIGIRGGGGRACVSHGLEDAPGLF